MESGQLVLEKYRLEGRLGEGGMGVVFAARQEPLGQAVALKVLLGALADDPAYVARFTREAQTVSRLRGRHSVRLLDFGRLDSGQPVIVMERLEGGDLASVLLQRGPLPIAEATDLALQACEGVAEAHALGLIHRDLKPSNLFLAVERDGTTIVKVLDFGIAKAIGGVEETKLTRTNAFVGSVAYAAPEQLRHRPVDARCDQWSIGVVLYEMVSGRLPFSAESTTDASISIATEPPAPVPPSVPGALATVILRCLEKDPARRFADIAELARALVPFGAEDAAARAERIGRVLFHRPSAAGAAAAAPVTPITSPGTSPGAGGGRRRSLALPIGGGLLLVAAAAGAAVMYGDDSKESKKPEPPVLVAAGTAKPAEEPAPIAAPAPAETLPVAAPAETPPDVAAPVAAPAGKPARKESERASGQYRILKPGDPLPADGEIMGGLHGTEAGEMQAGHGFGVSGTGPGGGGTGWGTIGTGQYGTIGHGSGTGSGYGTGVGRGGMRPSTSAEPQVRIGQPSCAGDLDKAIVRRYVKRNVAKIKYCYEKQLLAKPGLEGTVNTQFFMGANGVVQDSQANGVDAEVSTCVAAVIKTIHFPKPKGGGGVQCNYPFTFKPTGG